jgi:hypothetical protein
LIGKDELKAAECDLREGDDESSSVRYCCEFACRTEGTAVRIAGGTSVYAADALSSASNEEFTLKVHMRWTPTWSGARKAQASILFDLFGPLPFRPVTLDQSWLSWNDGIVAKIAQGIYEDRAFDRMPILHDALLDAGCSDEDLLLHCRNPEGHVRGCWVVDQILGKK